MVRSTVEAGMAMARAAIPRGIVWAYSGIGLVTVGFQAAIRLQQCAGPTDCAASLAKAVIWSIIWPAYWVLYVRGF
jgi:hypothetical protein